ncbi:GNAT family N-acetyltransferase [Mangrovicoccus sp. HB161399]|uniref:GNAT family N-acetyltransferase n=1 Tax=Mangrovicoccus sp. HB161399 TaxID=2720392 RepID=UPI0015534DF7|nr:GNAT family N-acetyltransferase [Mangrovicoccus sp. HB161399]
MEWTELRQVPELSPVPMQQHPAYGRACAAIGGRVAWFGLGPPRQPHAAAQVLLRRWPLFGDFALIARGPVWNGPVSTPEAAEATLALVRLLRRRCRGVIATPERSGGCDPLEGAGLLPMVTGSTLARLPLDGSEAERMARLGAKWRNGLRRARSERLDLSQGPLPADADHWLLRREEAQARSRGYKRLPRSFTYNWRVQNGARSARVFTASFLGQPAAAMLFLLHGKSATYHLGWSGEVGRRSGAHALLLWEASCWLADRGYRWADLGTLDTETLPGLARFKLGAGAEPLQLGATWMDAPGAGLCARLFGHGPRRPDRPAAAPRGGPSTARGRA